MKTEIKQRITQLNNGEIPNGYEKTEFGVFPADWVKDKSFGDLFEFYGGLGKSRDELGNEGHAYLHYGDMHRGSFNHVSYDEYMKLPKCDVALKGDESYLMNDGDIAFLDASEDLEGTSRAVLIDNPDNKPFIAGLHVIYAKSKDDSLEKWFKQYITLGESVKKQFQKLSVGFKVYGLNRYTLPRIQFSYPADKAEQSKIAEILMKWDEAIELCENLLNKMFKQRDYIINSLITPQGNWKNLTLIDVLTERSESTTINNQHTVLSSTKQGLFEQSEYFDKQVASENNIGYKIVRKGDIVLSPQNLWLGNINYNDRFKVGIVSPSYKIFEISNANKILVATIMRSPHMLHEYVLASEQGASVVRRNLNMELFFKINISLPTGEEQEKLGNAISSFNKLIDIYENKIDVLKEQRKTLQQYLLNGIVRVK